MKKQKKKNKNFFKTKFAWFLFLPLNSFLFLVSFQSEIPEYQVKPFWEPGSQKESVLKFSPKITKDVRISLEEKPSLKHLSYGFNVFGSSRGEYRVPKRQIVFSDNWYAKTTSFTNADVGYNWGNSNDIYYSTTTRIQDGVYNLKNPPRLNNSMNSFAGVEDNNFHFLLENVSATIKGKENYDYYFQNNLVDKINISFSENRNGSENRIDLFGKDDIRKEIWKTPFLVYPYDSDSTKKKLKEHEKLKEHIFENFGANLEYEVKDGAITKISTNLIGEYFVKEAVENPEIKKLNNYLEKLKESFLANDSFSNQYLIPTDNGGRGGLSEEVPVKTERDTNTANIKSNKDHFEDKIKEWWNKNSKTSNNQPDFKAKWGYDKWYNSNNPKSFWVEFENPVSKEKQRFFLTKPENPDDFPTRYLPTSFALQKEFSSRLEMIPSPVWKWDQSLRRLIKINAEKKQNPKTGQNTVQTENQQNVDGGIFEFVGDVKIRFNASKDGSEVLFINGRKIDVLNNNFETILEDLRLEKKENGGTNKYEIEIKKYKRNNSVNNQFKSSQSNIASPFSEETKENQKIEGNNEVEKTYKITLITKSIASVLQGKWFGWEPEKNINQKKLISPYLLNEAGEEIIGEGNKRLPNPEYDANVDPKTGTKKEILWVNNTGAELEDNIFYSDDNLFNKGFIAEASVVGKGVNLTFAQNFEEDKPTIKRYQVDKNQKDTLSLKAQASSYTDKGKSTQISNSENDYFSNEGLWLFRVGYESDQQAFKLFLIGDNDNTKLFSDIVNSDKIYIPFWKSPAGHKLRNYLKQIRKFSEKYIDNLAYERIIAHWKSYINYKLDKGEIRDPLVEEISKKMQQELEKTLRQRQKMEFSNGEEIKLKNIDFNSLTNYLSQSQKEKLKEIKFSPYKYNGDWNFQLDPEIARSLNIQKSLFEFPGLKTDSELEELKKNKKEIKIPDNLEAKIQELINKNPFENNNNLALKIGALINSEIKDENVGFEIRTSKNGDLDIKFSTTDKNFLNKDKYKTNIKQMQQKAQDNYNVFNVLPKDLKINLNGLTDPKKASDYIKEQIDQLSGGKLNFGGNYEFDSNKVLNNPELFRVFQGDTSTAKTQGNLALSGINLPGYTNLEIVNVVPNVKSPKERNLNKIKLDNVKINSNDPKEIVKQLQKELDKQLAPFGLNWQEYLSPLEFDNILAKIRHNKISEITFKPGNFLTQGDLKFKVENLDFSPYKFDSLKLDNLTKPFLENPKNLYWFIPVMVIILGTLSFGTWFLIRKKFKKFR